jgi:hypothetical protein
LTSTSSTRALHEVQEPRRIVEVDARRETPPLEDGKPRRSTLARPPPAARISLRISGKKALFFRLDTGYRFELSNFRTFEVETESTVSAPR